MWTCRQYHYKPTDDPDAFDERDPLVQRFYRRREAKAAKAAAAAAAGTTEDAAAVNNAGSQRPEPIAASASSAVPRATVVNGASALARNGTGSNVPLAGADDDVGVDTPRMQATGIAAASCKRQHGSGASRVPVAAGQRRRSGDAGDVRNNTAASPSPLHTTGPASKPAGSGGKVRRRLVQ